MHNLKGWVYEKLGNLPILFIDSDRSKRYPKRSEFQDHGIAFLNAESISSGRFDRTKVNHIPYEKYEEIKKGRVESGDIVLTMRGNGVGDAALIFGEGILGLINAQMLILRPDNEVINPKFLYYGFVSPQFKRELSNFVSGSAQPQLTMTHLRHVPFRLPPLPEQKAIAHILGSLDDKIELNRQMNETLEAMAQALFKSWFVDFDPVIDNALAAGKPIPDELSARAEQRKTVVKKDNADIQNVFPDEFEFTEEMGWIPKGWAVVELGDILERRNERVKAGGDTTALPYVPIDCISSKSLFLSESKNGNEAQSSLIKFHKDDFLFGAMRPYFHKVCIAPFYGTTRTTAFVLKPKLSFDYSFSLMQLFQKSTIDFATAGSVGSTIPYAKWDGSMSSIPITLPKEDIRKLFNNILRESFHTISIKYFENETLAKLRDTLLPKLMSGELRITDTAALVDEAI